MTDNAILADPRSYIPPDWTLTPIDPSATIRPSSSWILGAFGVTNVASCIVWIVIVVIR